MQQFCVPLPNFEAAAAALLHLTRSFFPGSRTGSKVAGSATAGTCIHRSCYITKLCYLLTIAFSGAPSGHLYIDLTYIINVTAHSGVVGFWE